MEGKHSLPRILRSAFLGLSSLLLLLALPLDVLLRLSSWIMSMPFVDIVRDVALMVLFLTVLSGTLALAISLIAASIAELTKRAALFARREATVAQRLSEHVYEVAGASCSLSVVWLMAIVVMLACKIWGVLATGGTLALGLPAFSKAEVCAITLVGCVPVVWLIRRFGFCRAGNFAQIRLSRSAKPVAVIVVLAAMVLVSYELLAEDPHGDERNYLSAIQGNAPNVILISMDALAAEDMSLYGYHLSTTPYLEKLGAESYVFDNFFSASNWTPPSIASLLSGLHPHSHGVNHLYGYFLARDRRKNLGSLLSQYGYQTAAIVANVMASPSNMHVGHDFSVLLAPTVRSGGGERFAEHGLRKVWAWYSYKYPRNHKWLSQWLQPLLGLFRNAESDEDARWTPPPPFDPVSAVMKGLRHPFFVWTHVYPPHAPYMPSSEHKYRFGKFRDYSTIKDFAELGLTSTYPPDEQPLVDKARLRYDEYILDVDSKIGAFLEQLRSDGYFENSIVIVTSDHGESFSRGKVTHGGPFLHRALIQIPLLIHLPGQRAGRRISFFSGHVDVVPTILDLLGLTVPPWVEGESLKPSMLQNTPTARPKLSMNLERDDRFATPRFGTVALMHDGWKLIRSLESGAEQLYRIAEDPSERVDLSLSHAQQASRLRSLIDESLRRNR
jgi:arylsulfatase A-like enzyme